jgi:hypothetical protein
MIVILIMKAFGTYRPVWLHDHEVGARRAVAWRPGCLPVRCLQVLLKVRAVDELHRCLALSAGNL